MTSALAVLLLASVPAVGDAPESDAASSIDKEVIRRVIRKHAAQVRTCYAAGLARDPELRGRLVLRLVIADTGRVESSSITSSELADERVGQCIADAALGWRFVSGARIIVSYPFIFVPETRE